MLADELAELRTEHRRTTDQASFQPLDRSLARLDNYLQGLERPRCETTFREFLRILGEEIRGSIGRIKAHMKNSNRRRSN